MSRALPLLLLAGALALPACTRDARNGGLTEQRFVAVLVELRQAARVHPDPEEFAFVRSDILDRHGVTDSALVAYARRKGPDVERMLALWERIAEELRREELHEIH
jgi:hypothetical protein